MKKIFTLIAAIAIVYTFNSCSSDNEEVVVGKNIVSIDFESIFAGNQFSLNKEYNVNGENIKISAFDYIVGNFVLVKDDGTEYVFPKEKSFFIISEGGKKLDKKTKEYSTVEKTTKVELKDIPAGKYTKIKFGVGVDEETYKKGDQFANKLWERAEKYSLVWNWASGYKFLVLEGMYGAEKLFKYHIAAAANKDKYVKAKDLYKEITLNLSSTPFLVANDKSPQLHLYVDAAKMLTAKNKIKVSETPVLMGPKSKPISDNSVGMFSYDHTHYNDHQH